MKKPEVDELKKISEVLGTEWTTPRTVAEELGTSEGVTRAALYWLNAERDEYLIKYKSVDRGVEVFFKRDVREKGGLFQYG